MFPRAPGQSPITHSGGRSWNNDFKGIARLTTAYGKNQIGIIVADKNETPRIVLHAGAGDATIGLFDAKGNPVQTLAGK